MFTKQWLRPYLAQLLVYGRNTVFLLKEIKRFMASQEDRLKAIAASLSNIQVGVDSIQQKLEDLKVNNPALEDEISQIEAEVAALVTDVSPTPPAEG